MAAQHEQAAGAASTERSAAGSLLREVAEVLVLAVILYIGIRFAVQAVHVEGVSMFATLDDNEYLMAKRIGYRLPKPIRNHLPKEANPETGDTARRGPPRAAGAQQEQI